MYACKYNEIHISNVERNTNKNVCLDREFKPGTPESLVRCSATKLSRPININGPARPIHHIPPFTMLLPLKKLTANTCLSCQDVSI